MFHFRDGQSHSGGLLNISPISSAIESKSKVTESQLKAIESSLELKEFESSSKPPSNYVSPPINAPITIVVGVIDNGTGIGVNPSDVMAIETLELRKTVLRLIA